MEYLEILNALLKWYKILQDIGGTPAMATAYLCDNLYPNQPKIRLAIKTFQLFQSSGKISLSESLWFLHRNFYESPLPALDHTEIGFQRNIEIIKKEKNSSIFSAHQNAEEMTIRCPGCGLPFVNFMELGPHVSMCQGNGPGGANPNPDGAAVIALERDREEARNSRAGGSGPIVVVEEAALGQTGKELLIGCGPVQEKGLGMGSCAAGGSRTIQENAGGSGTVQEKSSALGSCAVGGLDTVQTPSGSDPVAQFKCQKCGQNFATKNAVNGHQLKHKYEALKDAMGKNPKTDA